MISVSSLAFGADALDMRRVGSSRNKGEEFGVALEAQVSAAESARKVQEEPAVTSGAPEGQLTIDPTFVAVEQLASRPENVAGGLKSEVDAEMNSVTDSGVQTQQQGNQENVSRETAKNPARPAAGAEGKSQTGGTEATASNLAGQLQSDASKTATSGKATETIDSGQNLAKNEAAAQAPVNMGVAGTVVQGGPAGNASDRGSSGNGSARHSSVSAVDALGALGRKTVFKVVVSERELHKADVDKFVAQTAKALAAAVKREGGTIVMRMNPENLGLLKVRVETKDGSINARVEASESSARKLLVDDIESLRSALESHGVCVEKIEIVRIDDLQGLSAADSRGSGTDLGNSGRQAEDRQRDAQAVRRDAMQDNQNGASEFMDEPAGVYLCGVELRVDAVA